MEVQLDTRDRYLLTKPSIRKLKKKKSEKGYPQMMIFKIRFTCLGSFGIEGKRIDG